MRPTERYDPKTRQWHKVEEPVIHELHYVQGDIPEFHSPDGAYIRGQAQWREHLKRTGSIELGHTDLRGAQAQWQKRREQFQERVSRQGAREVEAPDGEIRTQDRSRLSAEVANRLDGRPRPDSKTMIKLALTEARALGRRR